MILCNHNGLYTALVDHVSRTKVLHSEPRLSGLPPRPSRTEPTRLFDYNLATILPPFWPSGETDFRAQLDSTPSSSDVLMLKNIFLCETVYLHTFC
jgi:hypothetical protein